MRLKTPLIGALFAICALPATAATIYDGITFPDGDASFADEVIAYALGDGVGANYDDPNDVLGAPDYSGPIGSFSLGRPGLSPDNLPDDQFGFVTIKFTDNSLTTSGDDSADLFVWEIGGAVESYKVEISVNAVDWIEVAEITGQPSTIDIDGVAGVTQGTKYSYVRVTDVPGGVISGNPFAGPDIDAIGAISSAPPVAAVPLPASGLLLLAGLGGLALRRRKG
ncbi:MAG: putative extracellular protein [Rhodobacteraceae bacterium HLUCCA08]|nr:MAG: putative extracellular protein [Rhodobacteraceae bacterium HLUCCA08]